MVKDYLWLNISSLPYFRGLLRAVEGKFYQEIELSNPVLDMGCGDGHFASIAFNKKVDVGIDPWARSLKKAVTSTAYHMVVCGVGNRTPFPKGYFNTVISNSVLEHIEDIDQTLHEIGRVIADGGLFVFCVPNQYFLSNLSISKFLNQINLNSLGDIYKLFFNKISRHHHCDSPDTWVERLEQHSLVVERWWHYFSPKALGVLEWGHYFGLPSLIAHVLFKRWILVPERWNLGIVENALRHLYEESAEHTNGSYTFYIARKKSKEYFLMNQYKNYRQNEFGDK